MKRTIYLLGCTIPLLMAGCQTATVKDIQDKRMSAADIRATLSDVTLDVEYRPKNARFQSYLSPDGALVQMRNGIRQEGRRWFVKEDGRRCVTNPRWEKPGHKWKDGRCFDVYSMGGGVYHMYDHGTDRHTHVLSNLRRGDQL